MAPPPSLASAPPRPSPRPQAPKITIDPTALKHGVWGNSWKEWGERCRVQKLHACGVVRAAAVVARGPLAAPPTSGAASRCRLDLAGLWRAVRHPHRLPDRPAVRRQGHPPGQLPVRLPPPRPPPLCHACVAVLALSLRTGAAQRIFVGNTAARVFSAFAQLQRSGPRPAAAVVVPSAHASMPHRRRHVPPSGRLSPCSGISGKYFGDFDRQLFNTTVDILPYTGGTRSPSFFNRPDGCTPLTVRVRHAAPRGSLPLMGCCCCCWPAWHVQHTPHPDVLLRSSRHARRTRCPCRASRASPSQSNPTASSTAALHPSSGGGGVQSARGAVSAAPRVPLPQNCPSSCRQLSRPCAAPLTRCTPPSLPVRQVGRLPLGD